MQKETDYIRPDIVNNLRELFAERSKRSPDKVAYEYFSRKTKSWKQITWQACEQYIQQWAKALACESLIKGDRVAILARNSLEWIIFEQACFTCGLTVVPLYTEDRADNICYILNDAEVKCILIENKHQWDKLYPARHELESTERIITIEPVDADKHDTRIRFLDDWVKENHNDTQSCALSVSDLASIVYTSGTTGKSKGVMLSHGNILQNAWSGANSIAIYPDDHFLSFLPMSHMLERTVGYYIPVLSGAKVSFSRSIADLAEDFLSQNPSVLISVPRIFERVFLKVEQAIKEKGKLIQTLFNYAIKLAWNHFLFKQHKRNWSPAFVLLPLFDRLFFKQIRNKFGNNFRFAISGGAALEFHVAQLFISIGIIIAQGYGMTEYSPVVSVNRLDDNDPHSVGEPLPGVEVMIGDNDELLVKGKSTMLGYWKHPDATQNIIDRKGWLHTGDQAKIENNKIHITGRIKDIIVLSNGEKIPPSEIELAILQDPLFENVIVIGEKRPYLSALVIPNYELLNGTPSINHKLLKHIQDKMIDFPGYAKIHKIGICKDPWTIENGLLTPTMKPRRKFIIARNKALIDEIYSGH